MKRIAITCGDPAGVGPEVIVDWLSRAVDWQERVCLIGPSHWLRQKLPSSRVEALPVGEETFILSPGAPSREGAELARQALEAAASGCMNGDFRAVVTGPTSKAWMQEAGFYYPGQTEFFADRWGGHPTMAFAGGKMRVVLVTWHVPLRDVSSHLSAEGIERAIRDAVRLCHAEGIAQPRIAVCGVNPHAGEKGVLGDEEHNLIDPVLNTLRPEFPGLSEALPGDTVWGLHLRGDYDLVVAMYHDQGLAPLKAIDFKEAVNITLGLPHIRTSPDHGTAFSIAGQGRADATSLGNAVEMAWKLSS